LLRPRSIPPSSGWRRAVFVASKGTVNPGPNRAEQARRELLTRVRRPLQGTHRVAVCSLKGGVGKTTVSALLGLTLAEHRGDRVIALDASPDAGTLADRLTGELGPTVRQLLPRIDGVDSLTAVCEHTASAGRLRVLATEQDPAVGCAFDRAEYERVAAVLGRFFNITVTDCGTGLAHSAVAGALGLADSVVVVGSPTVDGGSRAARTLDWLLTHGHGDLGAEAVVVLCGDRTSREVDRERLVTHLRSRCRAVLEVPYDPHLAAGGRLELAALREPTRTTFLRLAALIADRF
jgi:MinD-like ATPase involved in chromosome partitioning or flagellar assembly